MDQPVTEPVIRPAQTPERPAGPDGRGKPPEKPGNESRYAFNAVKRRRARETAPIILTEDAPTYFRRLKNKKVSVELRTLLRTQERSQIHAKRISKQIERLEDPADSEIAELEAQQNRYLDEGDDAAYGIIALLLRDDEKNPPSIELLEELDGEDAADLAYTLATGREVDPTPATTTT